MYSKLYKEASMKKEKTPHRMCRIFPKTTVVIIPQKQEYLNRLYCITEKTKKSIGGRKMAKKDYGLTDKQVEEEIARLNESEAVAIARFAARLKNRRRQYMYNLRDLEKKGKALLEAGITREMLERMYNEVEEEER
jgi:hypothetical protein